MRNSFLVPGDKAKMKTAAAVPPPLSNFPRVAPAPACFKISSRLYWLYWRERTVTHRQDSCQADGRTQRGGVRVIHQIRLVPHLTRASSSRLRVAYTVIALGNFRSGLGNASTKQGAVLWSAVIWRPAVITGLISNSRWQEIKPIKPQ